MILPEKELKKLYEIREKNLKLIFDAKTILKDIDNDDISIDEKNYLNEVYNIIISKAQYLLKFYNKIENYGELNDDELKELKKFINDLDNI